MQKRMWMASVALAAVLVAGVAEAQWTWTPQTGRWVNLKRLPKETPELQVQHARSLMLDGQYRQALRETDKFMDFYADTDYADENQFLRGEIRMRQGRLLQAAEEFQQVVTMYPATGRYQEVIDRQYEIADHYFDRGQETIERPWWRPFRKRPIRRAIEVYTMVIDNQPFTVAAAEAQYKVGMCHFVLEEYTEAAYEFRRVIEDYSGSEWVDDASHGLVMTYYKGSHPPQYDQTNSILAVNAIDQFRSRFPGDPRAAELDEIRVEMRERVATQRLLTAQFYENRRRFESARIYYELVVDDFPGTEAAEQAAAWLAEYEEGVTPEMGT